MTKFEVSNIQVRNAAGSFLGVIEDMIVECADDLDAIFEAVKAEGGLKADPSFTYRRIEAE